jgi:hypothetical protein
MSVQVNVDTRANASRRVSASCRRLSASASWAAARSIAAIASMTNQQRVEPRWGVAAQHPPSASPTS